MRSSCCPARGAAWRFTPRRMVRQPGVAGVDVLAATPGRVVRQATVEGTSRVVRSDECVPPPPLRPALMMDCSPRCVVPLLIRLVAFSISPTEELTSDTSPRAGPLIDSRDQLPFRHAPLNSRD
ncbi:hypothetical protein DPEC_G00243560 [Dallia pectoralis]|uniref:Uncharacterized protein n=1 Tax=Dallia pectoralis TaxID=75939 RepID=A0ACC2FVL3_DALPE|nr:hypothetical protein DPEC_G00243560 [Dallia pectoralis]